MQVPLGGKLGNEDIEPQFRFTPAMACEMAHARISAFAAMQARMGRGEEGRGAACAGSGHMGTGRRARMRRHACVHEQEVSSARPHEAITPG